MYFFLMFMQENGADMTDDVDKSDPPDGIMNVSPALRFTRQHLSTISPKKISSCFVDKVHFSYFARFSSVGSIIQKTFEKGYI